MDPKRLRRIGTWAGLAGVAVALAAVAIFAHRQRLASKEVRRTPPAVPPSVQQRSLQFTFAKTDGQQTVFTIHAVRATQYKGAGGSVLEGVDIVVLGEHGERHDEIRTRLCDYQSTSGSILCRGVVDLQLSKPSQPGSKSAPAMDGISVQTRDVSFRRDSGDATTPAALTFRFPGGRGSGVGAVYSSRASDLVVRHDVTIHLAPSRANGSASEIVAKEGLDFNRKLNQLHLHGPVKIRQQGRSIETNGLTIILDERLRPRRALLYGETRMAIHQETGRESLRADRAELAFDGRGRAETIYADGHVVATGEFPPGKIQAQRAIVVLDSANQQPHTIELIGTVRVDAKRPAGEMSLESNSLSLDFAAGNPEETTLAEALMPSEATVEWRTRTTQIHLKAGKITAGFGQGNQIETLTGDDGVQLDRTLPDQPPLTTSANHLAVHFSQGRWTDADESGNVRASQGVRNGEAENATWLRDGNVIRLAGGARVSDPQGAISADAMRWDQRSGQLQAHGHVQSSYAGGRNSNGGGFVTGPVNIVAGALQANSNTGHAVYSGAARMWSGDQVIQANRIELDRGRRELVATGRVIAAFPQIFPQVMPSAAQARELPVLWRVRSNTLSYLQITRRKGSRDSISTGIPGRITLEGGVEAWSSQGRIDADSLVLNLGQLPNGRSGMTQALATGHVAIRQGSRSGQAQDASYDPANGKFVLWGGKPSLQDASGDVVTGARLTFSEADDTILIESSEGSRTLTSHPVPN